MSFPSWRVESWTRESSFVGFRVVRGAVTVAPNGAFEVDPRDPSSKTRMRDAAIQLRDSLTAQESDPRVLAHEARDILRGILAHASASNQPTALIVPSIPLTIWLKDRLDKLCHSLNVKEDM